MAKVIKNIYNTTFRFGIFSALFLSVHVPCVSAQTGSTKVEGLVVDQQTREPLIGASISIEKGITATVSDVDGKFILF
ncbi:MAG: carboxypeptidase-like regulatory domain-containing protein, partial [Candidatus Symbiothrix sp.]|nr:carboxypeptidase-like regulatory domain-containing protein [Candidatus Symbiothrix sp.]